MSGRKHRTIDTDLTDREHEDLRLIAQMAGIPQRKLCGEHMRLLIASHRKTIDQFRAARLQIRKQAGVDVGAKRPDPTTRE